MNKKLQAHSAIFLANTIFGLGVPVTKLLLTDWVTPMGYMASRSLGACILFWIIAAFLPKEKVERRDLVTILFGGLLGFVISQTLTAWALDYTSPVYFSLIATLTPVAVMLCAALSIGEKITPLNLLLGQKGGDGPEQDAGSQRARGHIAHRGDPVGEQQFGDGYAKAEDGVGEEDGAVGLKLFIH